MPDLDGIEKYISANSIFEMFLRKFRHSRSLMRFHIFLEMQNHLNEYDFAIAPEIIHLISFCYGVAVTIIEVFFVLFIYSRFIDSSYFDDLVHWSGKN